MLENDLDKYQDSLMSGKAYFFNRLMLTHDFPDKFIEKKVKGMRFTNPWMLCKDDKHL